MKKFLPFFLLALAVFGIYAPALRDGFVWDDTALILRDPLIRSWRLIPEGFEHFLFTDATASDFYRPIQRLSYTLDYATVGFRPALYHFTSVGCHILAAFAFLLFARELLRTFGVEQRRREWIALIAALIWAIHPLQTSAIIYISGRADPLAALFGFSGLYLGFLSLRASGKKFWLLTIASTFAFLLSALSKEAGLIFLLLWPVMLMVQRNWRSAVGALLALALVLISYTSLRFAAERNPAPALRQIPALVRPILFARAIAEYTGLLLLPTNLQMERDVQTHPFGFSNESMGGAARRELQTLAGIILLCAFCFWLLRERRRDRAIFLCLLLTALTYLPISGLIPLNATVAEHWLYLPSAFFLLSVVSAGARFLMKQNRHAISTLTFSLLALWVIFLGARTFLRAFDWKDQRTFLENTLAHGGDSARMLVNLGGLESSEGHLEQAKKHLELALQKEPDLPFAVLNLAAVAVKLNDFKTAHELLERGARMPLIEAQIYELMAVLEHKETGQTNLLRVRLASRTGPPNWAIEKRYINLLDEIGNTDAAVMEARNCLKTQSYRAETWQLLGTLLAKSGHAPEATAAHAQAQRFDVWLGDERGVAPVR